jgi:hypothetical protein
MRAPFSTALAIGVGIVILLGYFLPLPFLQDIRNVLIGWAVTLAGVAGLVGIINLAGAHWRKLTAPRNRDYYSFILLLALIISFGAGLVLTPSDPEYQKTVTFIQMPVAASLMAVLAIVITLSGLRILQRRKGIMGIVFVGSTLVFMAVGSGLLTTTQSNTVGFILTALNWLPLAGGRGILLGIALGSLATGLRILMGADRPYSG